MNKRIIIMLIIAAALTGCSSEPDDQLKSGLQIYSSHSSIGALSMDKDNEALESYKYSIVITNEDKHDAHILTIEPILNERFKEHVIDQQLVLEVDTSISAGGDLEVSGEIIFERDGLTKNEIVEIEHIIESYKIIEETIIERTH